MKIKSLIIGAGIFSAGGAVGYFVSKRILTRQYLDDIQDVKEYYAKKLEELGVMDADFEPAALDEEDDDDYGEEEESDSEDDEIWPITGASDPPTIDPNDLYERIRRESIKNGIMKPIINYNKPPLEEIYTLQNGEEETDFEGEPDQDYEDEIEARADELLKLRMENESRGNPYVISYDEYKETPPEYEREVLYYYDLDRVLCEDDDSIVEDEEVLVGFEYEDVLEMQTIAWVRNDKLFTVYEIHRIDSSYSKMVANIVETPREREFRIMGRRKGAMDDLDS